MALNIERFGHLPLRPFPTVIKFSLRSLEVKWKQINLSAGKQQKEGSLPPPKEMGEGALAHSGKSCSMEIA